MNLRGPIKGGELLDHVSDCNIIQQDPPPPLLPLPAFCYPAVVHCSNKVDYLLRITLTTAHICSALPYLQHIFAPHYITYSTYLFRITLPAAYICSALHYLQHIFAPHYITYSTYLLRFTLPTFIFPAVLFCYLSSGF